jgi:hypothetical protein
MRPYAHCFAAISALCLALAAPEAGSQELEPRSYAASPVGLNLFIAGFARSSGEVLPDPSAPVEDVEAQIDAVVVGYARTFGLFGRSASVAAALPFASGEVSGLVGGTTRGRVERNGPGDTRVRFAVNLYGSPARTPQEFAREKPRATFGASLIVAAPSGQYDPDRLINLGTNRWAFKPEIGLSIPRGKWEFEGYAGVWLFTTNDDYFGGQRREQDPMVSLQAHVSYTFRPRLWLAFNSTWYEGGATTVDGVPRFDQKSNTRAGLTLSVPLTPHQSLKLAWSRGATTRIGSDFDTWGIFWTYAWADAGAQPRR